MHRTQRAPSTTRALLACLALTVLCAFAGAQEPPDAPNANQELSTLEKFDAWFGEQVVTPLSAVLFFQVGLKPAQDAEGRPVVRSIPLIVVVLFLGGIFFTFKFRFVNIRLFRHALEVIRGKYDDPNHAGEVSHFKALTSALSATIGLGNIAGVAVAITLGGPGAVFWMWFTAFFGMSMQFASTAYAQIYRTIHPDGRVLGGPMVYLEKGFKALNPSLAPLGVAFAVVFSVFTIFAAFGGGNMFQTNQTASLIYMQFFAERGLPEFWVRFAIGVTLAALVGVVIIGGIRRIGDITAKLVPAMCLFYCGVCLIIIALNLDHAPKMLASIFAQAFRPEAVYGGFIGVLVQGMRRAAFSNEAGVGSAAIAQAAAKTEEPVQAGVVAMLGPFIDTIIVCTMSALAILITEAHLTAQGLEGVQITAHAFRQLGPALPYVLCLAVFVFAYSTVISWGYYGERAVEYLFGPRGILPYRVVYMLIVIIGPLLSLQSVIDFSDMLLLSMAFPNIIGMAIISGQAKQMVEDYVQRLKSGQIKPVPVPET